MSPKPKSSPKTFDDATAWLSAHMFDVAPVPGVANQVVVRKYGCGAVLLRGEGGGIAVVTRPGCMIAGKIATLVDRGYQKFLVAGETRIAATADRLHALHDFEQELMEATGKPDYYNLALGTVSDLYLYDRVKGRETNGRDAEAAAGASH